ncbi:uncharacterized protein KQ657_001847 [Scheffersomyces spartinae]|uniref:Uncharacterized protein n=1 Tax=Scheffersomyces spartinae TaxID=45513 RepID=A0A9P8AH47_9ASCO|nr:uncharacterized protein KQ657_001847 [Scheffersomyces spartinae]KAG7192446.1 hypothetical protein KQ657_001847 [Scheffersomyces spartinae]
MTSLHPGSGLGNSIRLEQSFHSLVSKLCQYNHKVNVVYSHDQPLNTPVVVNLPHLGVRLLFYQDYLQLIEILNFQYLKLFFNNYPLNEIKIDDETITTSSHSMDQTILMEQVGHLPNDSTLTDELDLDVTNVTVIPPTLQQIYNKIFGPTCPGKLIKKADGLQYYILLYPGISFKFAINSSVSFEGCKVDLSDNLLLYLLNWDTPTDIICSSLAIFKGDSYEDFISNLKSLAQDPHSLGSSSLSYKSSPREIKNVKLDCSNRSAQLEFGNGVHYKLELDKTTQQEILNICGPPDAYRNKTDSQFLIHNLSGGSEVSINSNNGGSKSSSSNGQKLTSMHYKFYNYYKYGFDLLFSVGILRKVIIHNGNLIESLEFNKWSKCPWTITNPPLPNAYVITSQCYFQDIPQDALKILGCTGPAIINRRTVEDDNNGLSKTWGQSKLYACENIILEVLDLNSCILVITMF